jgi:hypothetical protein
MAKSAFEEPFNFPDRVTFGKYKGCDIRDVPTDYIEWFLGEGTPGTTRYRMFDEELKRRTAEKEDTQPVVTPKELPTFILPDKKETKEPEPAEDLLMVFSKEKIEELAISTYTRGYNAAYARLSVNIRAIPWVKTFYMDKFKTELLASLQEDRPIDKTKFVEEKPETEEAPVGGGSSLKKNPWYSQDNRK